MRRSAGTVRLTGILQAVGHTSQWYRRQRAHSPVAVTTEARSPRRRGPQPRAISAWEREVVVTVARACPWYGYKKIALICQRLDEPIARRKVYRILKEAGLLHQRKRRLEARARQEAAKLYQLLPQGPNELWQTDVTYIPIPGYGWWYAITVIDYYSRYLLAVYLTHSYSAAEAAKALRLAVTEAQRCHGPLQKPVFLVTDNGPSFIARRFRQELESLRIGATGVSAFSQVRIGYRMPVQLGLLERFHETLKYEEVYWDLYQDPHHARGRLALFHERYNLARPHWALCAADAATAPAAVLTPYEVYVQAHKVNPPPWSRWVGWLDKDQNIEAQPSHKTVLRVSA